MTYYQSPIIIDQKIGNNTFAYDERMDVFGKAEIVVPMMVEGTLEDVKVGKSIAFAEMEKGEVREYIGLEKIIRLQTTDHRLQVRQVPIYVIDNHNHALYCWYREFLAGRFEKGIPLIHIDQHSDMKDPVGWIDVLKEGDMDYIAQYTNEVCTIADFIKPAMRTGLVGECRQVRTEKGLLDYGYSAFSSSGTKGRIQNILPGFFGYASEGRTPYILDIDVDFWAPEMGIVEFEKTIEKIRALVQGACVVTIATSPHFIDQERAVEIIQKIFMGQ